MTQGRDRPGNDLAKTGGNDYRCLRTNNHFLWKMKIASAILKIVVLGLIGIGALSLFGVYVIPGMLLWWILRGRYEGWMGAATALLIVLILRLSMDAWPMRIGGQSSGEWFVELMLGIVSWAIGSILVTAGYNLPRFFLDGLGKKDEARSDLTGLPLTQGKDRPPGGPCHQTAGE